MFGRLRISRPAFVHNSLSSLLGPCENSVGFPGSLAGGESIIRKVSGASGKMEEAKEDRTSDQLHELYDKLDLEHTEMTRPETNAWVPPPAAEGIAGTDGTPGAGAGRGGGGGGAIREAGGAFDRMEAAREEQFFYNQSKDQLQKLHEKQGQKSKNNINNQR